MAVQSGLKVGNAGRQQHSTGTATKGTAEEGPTR